VSFASAEALAAVLPKPHEIHRSVAVPLVDFAGRERTVANVERRERTAMMVSILRQAWDRFVASKCLASHMMSGERSCVFLRHEDGGGKRVTFVRSDGVEGWRTLVGYRTVLGPTPDAKQKRYWHFALSAKPLLHPILGYALFPHVLFSDDGVTIWESAERLHSARRRQCWDWWNDDWRDRILAFLSYLSDGADVISLPAGDRQIELSAKPVTMMSPVDYRLLSEPSRERSAEDERVERSEELQDGEVDDDQL
jgi:hypothetical protein